MHKAFIFKRKKKSLQTTQIKTLLKKRHGSQRISRISTDIIGNTQRYVSGSGDTEGSSEKSN